MSKRMICNLVAILLLTLPVSGVWAAEMLPEGVTMVVLKESPVTHLPGVVKVKLMELRIAPGTEWMNNTISTSGFAPRSKAPSRSKLATKPSPVFLGKPG